MRIELTYRQLVKYVLLLISFALLSVAVSIWSGFVRAMLEYFMSNFNADEKLASLVLAAVGIVLACVAFAIREKERL